MVLCPYEALPPKLGVVPPREPGEPSRAGLSRGISLFGFSPSPPRISLKRWALFTCSCGDMYSSWDRIGISGLPSCRREKWRGAEAEGGLEGEKDEWWNIMREGRGLGRSLQGFQATGPVATDWDVFLHGCSPTNSITQTMWCGDEICTYMWFLTY